MNYFSPAFILPTPPLKMNQMSFRLPLYSGLVPPEPRIATGIPIEPPKPPPKRKIKIKVTKGVYLLGFMRDRKAKTLYIFLPKIMIEIPLKQKQ